MSASNKIQQLDGVPNNAENVRKGRGGAPRHNRNAAKHALYSARRTLSQFGLSAVDGRSKLGVALRQFRADIVADLGGEAALSAQQKAVLDVLSREKVLLDSLDFWILKQRSLVTGRGKTSAVLPVLKERQALANAFVANLQLLGLERRQPPTPSLQEFLARRAQERAATGTPTSEPSVPVNAPPAPSGPTPRPVPEPVEAAAMSVNTTAPGPAGDGEPDEDGVVWRDI